MHITDDVDKRILRELRKNGRITYAELSDLVALSPTACMRRVGQMEKAGVIRGYTTLIAGDALGEPITVIAQVTLERQTEQYLNRFEEAVRRCPAVRECFLMTGTSDYLLRIDVESASAFERVQKELLSALPGVQRINSTFSIKNVLQG